MKWTRRDVIKGLGSLPIAGGVWWAGASDGIWNSEEGPKTLEQLDIEPTFSSGIPIIGGAPLRVGIVGYGIRGRQLCNSLGFVENPTEKHISIQKQVNINIVGVCDVFDVRAAEAIKNISTKDNAVIRYRTHQEMIRSGKVDAIIIASPDHWHAPMAIDALENDVHAYVEKPMSHNIEETYRLKEAAEKSNAHLMVGHQHRQTLSFQTASDVIKKGALGHISLIQTNTNRNSDNGAWQYPIHKDANEQTIDWDLFLGNVPEKVPFNKEHFFRWRKWWAYGSGLSGDLLSHDYDRLNCVLNMGIPNSIVASGGVYTHNDGRNVPDVLQVNMEYPDFSTGATQEKGKEKGMTFVYSASLGNGFGRSTKLMGHDGTMELGNKITIWPDGNSTQYKDKLQAKRMKTNIPIYTYNPGANIPDAISSATSKYFADKGLMWTFIDGKRVDSTFLHIREWLSVIKNGGKLSCGIKEGFEEAITSHMAGLSYKLGRKIEWDNENQIIKPIENINFDDALLDNG